MTDQLTATEIREALTRYDRADLDPIFEDDRTIVDAARAYADLLDNGEVVEAYTRWPMGDREPYWKVPGLVPEPGRYLIVRVGESP